MTRVADFAKDHRVHLLQGAQELFPALIEAMDAALSVLIEVTGGVRKLSFLGLKREALLPLVSFACGFGGLSIQLQNAAFLSERGVRLPLLFVLGLLRGALAALLCRLLIF